MSTTNPFILVETLFGYSLWKIKSIEGFSVGNTFPKYNEDYDIFLTTFAKPKAWRYFLGESDAKEEFENLYGQRSFFQAPDSKYPTFLFNFLTDYFSSSKYSTKVRVYSYYKGIHAHPKIDFLNTSGYPYSGEIDRGIRYHMDNFFKTLPAFIESQRLKNVSSSCPIRLYDSPVSGYCGFDKLPSEAIFVILNYVKCSSTGLSLNLKLVCKIFYDVISLLDLPMFVGNGANIHQIRSFAFKVYPKTSSYYLVKPSSHVALYANLIERYTNHIDTLDLDLRRYYGELRFPELTPLILDYLDDLRYEDPSSSSTLNYPDFVDCIKNQPNNSLPTRLNQLLLDTTKSKPLSHQPAFSLIRKILFYVTYTVGAQLVPSDWKVIESQVAQYTQIRNEICELKKKLDDEIYSQFRNLYMAIGSHLTGRLLTAVGGINKIAYLDSFSLLNVLSSDVTNEVKDSLTERTANRSVTTTDDILWYEHERVIDLFNFAYELGISEEETILCAGELMLHICKLVLFSARIDWASREEEKAGGKWGNLFNEKIDAKFSDIVHRWKKEEGSYVRDDYDDEDSDCDDLVVLKGEDHFDHFV